MILNNMKVLITGGSGFIGYHLARYHLQRKDNVILIDNLFKQKGFSDPDFDSLRTSPFVQFINWDMTKPFGGLAAFKNIPDDLDIVYHLGAINGTRLFYEMPYQVSRTNLLLTINLLDWLKEKKVKRFIYTSSSEVYAGAESVGALKIPTSETVPVVFSQPTNVRFSYGASKFMGEVLCINFAEKFDLPTTVIRYHNIYGPRMGNKHVIPEFIMRIKAKETPFSLTGKEETRAFCYVDDAVEGTFKIAQSKNCIGETIHVGNSEEEIRISDLAILIMDQMGFSSNIVDSGRNKGSVSRRCPDTSKLKELTGFCSKISLAEGVKQTIKWYHKNK